MTPALNRILAIGGAVFVIDQALKYWIVQVMDLPTQLLIDVFPPFLRLVMAWNRGINFGLFGTDAEAMRWVLIAVAMGISAGLVLWARRAAGWMIPLAVGLIVGGALGNALDRVIYGAVADFLNMSCCGFTNPYAFNVADIAIFLGAVLLILLPQNGDKKPKTPGRNNKA